MKTVELSARMQALVDMVSRDMVVCDVGCDHGFVSIYLIQQKIAPKVYAMDVRTGPLERAKEHIKEYGLEAYIETRLSDGLQALQMGEASCMICAGMGGPLMMRILQEGSKKAHAMSELILQPQSEIEVFRKFLRAEGYKIVQENMIYEDGKYYPMMKAVPVEKLNSSVGNELTERTVEISTSENSSDRSGVLEEEQKLWDTFGELLLKQKNPVLAEYLLFSIQHVEGILQHVKTQGGERVKGRVLELEEEIKLLRLARTYMEK